MAGWHDYCSIIIIMWPLAIPALTSLSDNSASAVQRADIGLHTVGLLILDHKTAGNCPPPQKKIARRKNSLKPEGNFTLKLRNLTGLTREKLHVICMLYVFLPRDASAERGDATVSRPSVRDV